MAWCASSLSLLGLRAQGMKSGAPAHFFFVSQERVMRHKEKTSHTPWRYAKPSPDTLLYHQGEKEFISWFMLKIGLFENNWCWNSSLCSCFLYHLLFTWLVWHCIFLCLIYFLNFLSWLCWTLVYVIMIDDKFFSSCSHFQIIFCSHCLLTLHFSVLVIFSKFELIYAERLLWNNNSSLLLLLTLSFSALECYYTLKLFS